MKKITLLFVSLLIYTLSTQAQNDTTFIQTGQVQLNYFGNFDQNVTFPDTTQTYRKIIMTLTLGQYDCGSAAQYCHQWDYDVHIQLLTDSTFFELGRFITPFATSGWSRFGPQWKQPYVFDVTDFYPLLHGQKTVRIRYAGYSGGFTAKLEFAFIEGTPEREVLGIEKAYQLSQTFGDPGDPFNAHLPTFSDTAPAGTQAAALKVIVTGHGADDNNCCEFMSNYYNLKKDGNQIAHQEVWRSDCGKNDLYPQGGTWVHNRSNWCPGAKVIPTYHKIPNIAGGDTFNLDLQFENYVGSVNQSNAYGNYKLSGYVFYYGNTNKTLDAAITDIVTPTNNPNHFRANPSGNTPVIKVRNTGSTPITSLVFSYGVNGNNSATHTWTGSLPPQTTTTIVLSPLEALTNLSLAETQGTQKFQVNITAVNSQTDDDGSNDTRSSVFEVTPKWPYSITVKMKTNNIGSDGYLNSNPADVSWKILDMQGNIVASRVNANTATLYTDNVTFTKSGFYKFKLTSVNCFGLHWWAFSQGIPAYQGGNLRILDANGNSIPMHNYTYGTYIYGEHDDWGCEYVQYFSVDVSAGVETVAPTSFKVYPIPAKEQLNIDFEQNFEPPYQIRLINILGKTVYQTTTQKTHVQIPVTSLEAGVYFLHFQHDNHQKQVQKVLIGK